MSLAKPPPRACRASAIASVAVSTKPIQPVGLTGLGPARRLGEGRHRRGWHLYVIYRTPSFVRLCTGAIRSPTGRQQPPSAVGCNGPSQPRLGA
jgi:hypothetical protein